MGQDSPREPVLMVPFTDEELFQAYRVTDSAKEAREAVAELAEATRRLAPYREWRANPAHRGQLPPESMPIFGIYLSDDTLIILSLLNEDLRRRVHAYLEKRSNEAAWPMWEERRALLAPWVAMRLSEIRAEGDP